MNIHRSTHFSHWPRPLLVHSSPKETDALTSVTSDGCLIQKDLSTQSLFSRSGWTQGAGRSARITQLFLNSILAFSSVQLMKYKARGWQGFLGNIAAIREPEWATLILMHNYISVILGNRRLLNLFIPLGFIRHINHRPSPPPLCIDCRLLFKLSNWRNWNVLEQGFPESDRDEVLVKLPVCFYCSSAFDGGLMLKCEPFLKENMDGIPCLMYLIQPSLGPNNFSLCISSS